MCFAILKNSMNCIVFNINTYYFLHRYVFVDKSLIFNNRCRFDTLLGFWRNDLDILSKKNKTVIEIVEI